MAEQQSTGKVGKQKRRSAKRGTRSVKKKGDSKRRSKHAAGGGSKSGFAERARERLQDLIDAKLQVIVRDPLRAQIVAVAIQRPYSPSEFARDVSIPINTASYHFRILRDHGILELIELIERGASQKHMYRATQAAFISDLDWAKIDQSLRAGFLGTILHDFGARVEQAIDTGTLLQRDDFTLYWAPVKLDEIAYQEHAEIVRWCIEETEKLEADTVRRHAEGKSEGGFPITFAIAAFLSPTHHQLREHVAELTHDGDQSSSGKTAGEKRSSSTRKRAKTPRRKK